MGAKRTDWSAREKSSSPLFYAFFLIVGLTGFVTIGSSGQSAWVQASYLVHSLLGLTFCFVAIPFIWHHFRKSLGQRRPSVLISGVLLLAVLFAVVAGGATLAITGQIEKFRWIYTTHLWLAFSLFAVLLLHVVLHRVTINRVRKRDKYELYPTLHRRAIRAIVLFSLLVTFAISGITGVHHVTSEPYSRSPVAEPYQFTYGDHPFRPSQTETYHGAFVDIRQIGGSENCAGCHADIAEQWLASAHRKAASDPAYTTNVTLLAKKKDITATRYCEGCHAPIALLTGELSEGGSHGGIAGSPGNVEGVGCMGCHGISKAVHLKGNGSYEFEPAADYLFQTSENSLAKAINQYVVKVGPRQHRNDLSREVLSSPDICATCHAQFMDTEMNSWGWVKMQDEYAAWLDSPFSGQHEQAFAEGDIKTCQDCHMPLEELDDPSANSDGLVRSHDFAAANTMLALVDGDQAHLEKIISFLQKNKMQVHIETPTRQDATQNRFALSEDIRATSDTPAYYYLGEYARVNVVVANSGVGHNFPGGTIDINEAWIDFSVLDAEGREVFRSGDLVNDEKAVDPKAKFYRSLPVDKGGKHVWKHDLFNMVGHAEKSVIPAGSADIEPYRFKVPNWAKSPLTIGARLRYRKLNNQYAQWALKEKFVPLPIVDMARDSIVVPLRKKTESQAASMGDTTTNTE
ncbi:multiheme c-type cytochrome [Marinobacter salarius]|uniref:multiheme c-type cytochrome n=1 Tax=Marinobacter salarius TaxID=1420917 RepID=UPI003BAC6E39